MMTGATGGIGQAVAAALAAAGHRLTVVGRDLDRLHVLAAPPDAYVSELTVSPAPPGP